MLQQLESVTVPGAASVALTTYLSPLSQDCIADLVSADDSGLLCVWKSGEDFQLLNKIPGFE